TVKELGGTTCSSSGCGAASNMRRYICEPTTPSVRHGNQSAVISTSTTAAVLIRVLTAAPRIKPTSTRRQSGWRLNPGRPSTYSRGDSVQTTGTSSPYRNCVGYELPGEPDELNRLINSTTQGKHRSCPLVFPVANTRPDEPRRRTAAFTRKILK